MTLFFGFWPFSGVWNSYKANSNAIYCPQSLLDVSKCARERKDAFLKNRIFFFQSSFFTPRHAPSDHMVGLKSTIHIPNNSLLSGIETFDILFLFWNSALRRGDNMNYTEWLWIHHFENVSAWLPPTRTHEYVYLMDHSDNTSDRYSVCLLLMLNQWSKLCEMRAQPETWIITNC